MYLYLSFAILKIYISYKMNKNIFNFILHLIKTRINNKNKLIAQKRKGVVSQKKEEEKGTKGN